MPWVRDSFIRRNSGCFGTTLHVRKVKSVSSLYVCNNCFLASCQESEVLWCFARLCSNSREPSDRTSSSPFASALAGIRKSLAGHPAIRMLQPLILSSPDSIGVQTSVTACMYSGGSVTDTGGNLAHRTPECLVLRACQRGTFERT